MCSVCNSMPHDPRCPYASEQEEVYICKKCKDKIMAGEKFLETEDGEICETCIDNMTREEILEMFGEKMQIA